MNGVKPNKENQRRFEIIRDIGCIVCKIEGKESVPCTWHHLDGQKNQEKHKLTIGLCYEHHDSKKDTLRYTSVHPYKARFEMRYLPLRELLEYQNLLIKEYENT